MSATDIAKDIVRIANTATLSKDVIDLLEKKLALLTEEIAGLRAKASRLETENANLQKQIQHLKPAGSGLDDDSLKVLRFFFDAGSELSIPQVAQQLGFQASVAEFHFDELMRRRFVRQSRVGFGDHSGYFELLPEGRRYVMANRT